MGLVSNLCSVQGGWAESHIVKSVLCLWTQCTILKLKLKLHKLTMEKECYTCSRSGKWPSNDFSE